MRIARAPQQLAARLAERVERAEQREVAQRLLLEPDAPREFVEVGERVRLFSRCSTIAFASAAPSPFTLSKPSRTS